MGSTPFSGNSLLDNSFSLIAAIPIRNQPFTTRSSGWTAGFGAGIAETNYQPGRYFSPGLYFWELMLGRGTYDIEPELDSGLRGYLEFAIRDERPRVNATYSEVVTLLNRDIPDNDRSLILRIGVEGGGRVGSGFVEQKARRNSIGIHLGIHLPLVSRHAVLLSVATRYTVLCYDDWILCGASLDLAHSQNPEHSDAYQDVENSLSTGPVVNFIVKKKYLLRAQLQWQINASHTRSVGEVLPLLKTSLTIGL